MSKRAPKICDLVVYSHPSSKDQTITKMLKSPAVVQQVLEDGTLDLCVFSVAGCQLFRGHVEQGDKEYQWNWPPKE